MADAANQMEVLPSSVSPASNSQTVSGEEAGTLERRRGWMYRDWKVGSVRIPWYASPPVQVGIVAFVCFLCPGMFNALIGVGGSGQINHHVADNANTALYSTFAVCSFFAGSFINVLGIKVAVSLAIPRTLASLSLRGALLGFSAALLWTAEGTMLMSYPSEKSKGKYISGLWMIFNLGSVTGSLIPLGQNINVEENRTVTNGTYIGFLALTVLGIILAWGLVDAKSVVREDGSGIILMKKPSWQTEVWGIYETLWTQPYIFFLLPMFFTATWSYTYVFNDVNAVKFNTRTRALNNTLYYIMEMAGGFVFGYILDRPWVKRSTRARMIWLALMALTMAVWGGSYAFQRGFSRADSTAQTSEMLDWKDSGYIGPMFLYMFYGFFDAAWHASVYWIMGSLTNNARTLAIFAGLFNAMQSSGSAIVWRLDSLETPYMGMLASCWALYSAALVIALPVILFKIKDQTKHEEDEKFTDGKVQDATGLEVLPE